MLTFVSSKFAILIGNFALVSGLLLVQLGICLIYPFVIAFAVCFTCDRLLWRLQTERGLSNHCNMAHSLQLGIITSVRHGVGGMSSSADLVK